MWLVGFLVSQNWSPNVSIYSMSMWLSRTRVTLRVTDTTLGARVTHMWHLSDDSSTRATLVMHRGRWIFLRVLRSRIGLLLQRTHYFEWRFIFHILFVKLLLSVPTQLASLIYFSKQNYCWSFKRCRLHINQKDLKI